MFAESHTHRSFAESVDNRAAGDSHEIQDTHTAPFNTSGVGWEALVDGIREGDTSAMEELYRVFSRGTRFYICRHLGPQDLDDRVHDAFIVVVGAIRRGALREPQRLMGFVHTIVRRQIAGHIDAAVHRRADEVDVEVGSHIADGRPNPESGASERQRAQLMKKALGSLSVKDREILTRFYLHEQPPEQICREMSLSETQFRLLKSRAKARLGAFGKSAMKRRPICAIHAAPPSVRANEFTNARLSHCCPN